MYKTNKPIKSILIIILNLFLVIILFFIIDYCVYLKYSNPKYLKLFELTTKNPYRYYLKNIYVLYTDLHDYFDGSDNKFKEKVADEFLLYFTQTRNALEKEWNNKIKFNVILYDDVPPNCGIPNKDTIKRKLEENNFNVIDINDLTDEDLNSEKYLMQDNLHPTEAAWDLLTHKIIKNSLL